LGYDKRKRIDLRKNGHKLVNANDSCLIVEKSTLMTMVDVEAVDVGAVAMLATVRPAPIRRVADVSIYRLFISMQ
jgi:hypothetical protein